MERCRVEKGHDTETTEGSANSYRSLKKPGRLQTAKKAGQRAARVVRAGIRRESGSWTPDFEQVAEKRQACDVAKNDTNLAKQSAVLQEHTAQREVVAVEEQQKIEKKSLKIQVEKKQVAEINTRFRQWRIHFKWRTAASSRHR